VNKPVVTGQQIGLLGGPLYTTYKVLGAISYSKSIEGTPVYWLETNDADFQEINSIHFIDKENKLQSLTWDINSQGYSCGYIEVDNKLLALFDTFFSSINQTSYTNTLRTIVFECYRTGITLGNASLEFAKKLFGWSGIRVFDPSSSDFLNAVRPILETEAERTPPGQQCNIFCIDNKRRMAVFRKPDGFYFRDGKKIQLKEYPLTPNVKTRNVCQDAYFKTHTYIAGPGEIKYIAELDHMYDFYSVRKPDIKKRMSIDLIEPRTSRLFTRCGLDVKDTLSASIDILFKQIIKRETGTDLNKIKQSAAEITDAYIKEISGLGLETAGLNKLLYNEIKQIIGKKRSHEKTKLDTILQKAKECSDRVLPFGKKQERIFNLVYYMNQYGGLDFIQWLYSHYNFNNKLLEIRL